MFGKKKKSDSKPKFDDAAKAAVLAASAGDGAGGVGGGAAALGGGAGPHQAASGAQLLSQALERYNARMRRICRAGAALAGIAAALLLIGALLTHFFKAHVRTDNWRRVPGIVGIVLLLFSLLVLAIGIALLVWAYNLLKNREREGEHRARLQAPQPGSLPSSAYPRQEATGGPEEAVPLQPKESAPADAADNPVPV